MDHSVYCNAISESKCEVKFLTEKLIKFHEIFQIFKTRFLKSSLKIYVAYKVT